MTVHYDHRAFEEASGNEAKMTDVTNTKLLSIGGGNTHALMQERRS